MNLHSVQEGVGIATESLRANKVRAALTILGVVIGVATVMMMAAMIVGVRSTVMDELSALGPDNFTVRRFDPSEVRVVNIGPRRPPWAGRPVITMEEAALVEALPTVNSVTPSLTSNGELRHGSESLEFVEIRGQGHLWPEYATGEFLHGRNFIPVEEGRAARVTVLSERASEALFGAADPSGREVRILGEAFRVVGVFRQPDNIFVGASMPFVVVPVTSAMRRLGISDNEFSLLVVPAAGAPAEQVMDQVTATLRSARGLRPGEENDFGLVRQEALADLFDQFTGVFFLVMLVLSSIGLMVGGVGVVGIMMISVTERTREIGVRKALGATRREILWQFLVEAMTVTLIGGAIGMLVGGGGAMLIDALTPVPASVPLWAVAAALGVSAITGIGFGMYPANKAARLDPVEALRYE
ncbi:MAG TPA: ABC transporter permease [Longimicrobiaceae bacterium]|nr:ABC transporter permease [Longimicrobiaceae bacterium]